MSYVDPLGVVVTAVKVGKVLYCFIQQTKNVDQSVEDLYTGVHQVEQTCQFVDKQLKKIQTEGLEHGPELEELLQRIDTQISNCAVVVHRINSKLESVREKRESHAKQVVCDKIVEIYNANSQTRQFKLNLSKDEIDECRKQLQARISNLQVSLQLVILHTVYLAPKAAHQTLDERLDQKGLKDKIDEIHKILTLHTIDDNIRKCASAYLNRGETLYAKSVASTSQLAQFRSSARPVEIAQWLGKLDASRVEELEDGEEQNPVPPVEVDACSSQSPSSHLEDSIITPLTGLSLLVDQNDSEDEFDADMAQTGLEAAREIYEAQRYKEAESMLDESLSLIVKLPEHERRQKAADLDEIHLLLALCSYELYDTSVSEAALLSVMERTTEAASERHLTLRFQAATALAIVYLKTAKYDFASMSCKNVLRGRMKIFGQDADACHESRALLAYINEKQGLTARANIHRAKIPKGKREALCTKYKELLAEDSIENDSVITTIASKESLTQEDEPQHSIKEVTREGKGNLSAVAWSNNGKTLACAVKQAPSDSDASIILLSVVQGGSTGTIYTGKRSSATCLAFDSSDSILASGHGGWHRSRKLHKDVQERLHICLWSIETGKIFSHILTLSQQTDLRMNDLVFVADNAHIAILYSQDTRCSPKTDTVSSAFEVYDRKSKKLVGSRDRINADYIESHYRDNHLLGFDVLDGSVSFYRTGRYEAAVQHLSADNAVVRWVDGRYAVTIFKDGNISFFDIDEKLPQETRLSIPGVIDLAENSAMAINLDGNLVIAAILPSGESCRLFEPQTGKSSRTLSLWHKATPTSVSLRAKIESFGMSRSATCLAITANSKLNRCIVGLVDVRKELDRNPDDSTSTNLKLLATNPMVEVSEISGATKVPVLTTQSLVTSWILDDAPTLQGRGL